ncbi:tyrosine-type recombinase/integrase [Streptomyces sp. NPDC057746]|uniref:tyrosine-type recombinase/integrase n=1 Tax=Streptomyces sp. NPDC057746 TaxID=3346237 RepID=UPI00369A565B
MLRAHAETQERERKTAGDLWAESDYVFTKRLGGPLSPNTDYHDWKRLLQDAGVRNARLHDARHTAATVLMLLGVPDRVIDQIMGGSRAPPRACVRGTSTCPTPCSRTSPGRSPTSSGDPRSHPLWTKNQDNEV